MDWVTVGKSCKTEINPKHDDKKKSYSTHAERSRCHQNHQTEITTPVHTEGNTKVVTNSINRSFIILRLQQNKLFLLKLT